jgi:hypothetical protein
MIYRIDRVDGIWGLHRGTRVLRRSRDKARIDRDAAELASAEAERMGRAVEVRYLDGRAEALYSLIFRPGHGLVVGSEVIG